MKNKLLGISTLTLVGLYAVLSIVIIGGCLVLKLPVQSGIILSIIVLIVQFLIAPFLTDLSMNWFYKIDFNPEIPDYLKEFIYFICKKENIKCPKIGLINDGAPNAFTYGRFKNDARLVITRGILELLEPEEVKSVVAHEFGHIVHMDMFFMTAASVVPLVLYYLAQSFISSDNSDNDKNSGASIGAIAYVLYIISQFVILWLSRTREYYADSYSVEVTKNPNALSSSLVKIGFGLSIGKKERIENINEDDHKNKKTKKIHSASEIGALGIFDAKTSKSLIISTNNNINNKISIKNAMKWEMWNPWAFIYELNSTHPLISKRLINISNYSRSYNQEPFITFDLKQEESYIDDFFLELLIKISPVFSAFLTIAIIIITNPSYNMGFIYLGLGLLLTTYLLYLGFRISHKTGYEKKTIRDLLGEVKVSGITSVPCILEGKIIGKGDPGCIFSEDFVIQDETGIMFLDYNQPLFIFNKIFAIFKSHQYVDQNIKIKGWYRRSPVPYVEIYEMEFNGKIKEVFTYKLCIFLYLVFFVISIILFIKGLGIF